MLVAQVSGAQHNRVAAITESQQLLQAGKLFQITQTKGKLCRYEATGVSEAGECRLSDLRQAVIGRQTTVPKECIHSVSPFR